MTLRDRAGGPLTESDYIIEIRLVNQEDENIVYSESKPIEKLSDFLYQVETVVFIRSIYILYAKLYEKEEDGGKGSQLGQIGNTPYPIYWDSHYAYYEQSTVDYPTSIYTGFFETFQLQVRDKVSNLYNAETHQEHMGADNSVHQVDIKGVVTGQDDADIQVDLIAVNEWSKFDVDSILLMLLF